MTTMKAVICEKYGPPEVLQLKDIEKPTPKPNEILIKVRATAVNSGDVRVRGLIVDGFLRVVMRLVLGFRGPRQPILGAALSGEIEAVGSNVTKFKPGDEVYAMTGFKMGGYAEYIALSETATVALKPSTASHEQAAAIPFGGTTALHFLRKAGIETRTGQKVLIYGASGAVGTAAVQVAKHFGAEVTAVCSGKNIELVQSIGSDHAIDYTTDDFTKNDEKYDIIFDAVGKISRKQCAGSLADGGKYVTVGGLDTAKELKTDLQLLAKLFDDSEYISVIDKTYPLDQIVDAHKYVEQGHKRGNVAITVAK